MISLHGFYAPIPTDPQIWLIPPTAVVTVFGTSRPKKKKVTRHEAEQMEFDLKDPRLVTEKQRREQDKADAREERRMIAEYNRRTREATRAAAETRRRLKEHDRAREERAQVWRAAQVETRPYVKANPGSYL